MRAKLGQVFLHDQNIIRKIVRFSNIDNEDCVLEIGCGEGILTKALSDVSHHVTVIEIDKTCIELTQTNVKATNIDFVHHDVLKVDITQVMNRSFKLIANVPYYLSAKLIQHIVEHRSLLSFACIMFQKEFSNKLCASPGQKDYTSLTLYTCFYFETSYLFTVSKTCFNPVPKVDSAVVSLIPRKKPLFDVDESLFFKIINSAFWGRRKTLSTALKKSPHIQCNKTIKDVVFLKKNPLIRGEMLSIDDFYQLYLDLIHANAIS